MASMNHRVATLLAAGCTLVLAVSLSGCSGSAAPQYTDVSDPEANIHFAVPDGWHQISRPSLDREMGGLASAELWMVAYDAGPEPKASDLVSFDITQPFVVAWSGTLSSALSLEMSDQMLRDFFLPVTPAARQQSAAQGFQATGFRQIRDQVLTLRHGVHGVRETYDYTVPSGYSVIFPGADNLPDAYSPVRETDTFDTEALTNADHTAVFFLVVHCTSVCYGKYRTEIANLMSSVTAQADWRGAKPPRTG